MGFGRLAQTALAASAVLARNFDGGHTRLSSVEIASACGQPQPVVAKVLVALSARGLVDGTRGPGGGYWLAVPPVQVALLEIVVTFERTRKMLWPLAEGDVASGEGCPVAQMVEQLCGQWREYLRSTTLAVFQAEQRGGDRSVGLKVETRDKA